MSRRTVTRCALIASLALSLPANATAQTPPVAPMPRPTSSLEIELTLDFLKGFDFEIHCGNTAAVPTMPLPVPPCCAFDCPARTQVETGPMPECKYKLGNGLSPKPLPNSEAASVRRTVIRLNSSAHYRPPKKPST